MAHKITILGATGSIGRSTLDVIARHPERFEVFALTANERIEELARLCATFSPRFACVSDPGHHARFKQLISGVGVKTEVLSGPEGLVEVASHPEVDQVMAAIVGAAGLRATLAAAKAGKKILLANKEALVMTGPLFMNAVRDGGATLLPIDSEHNAVFQCLPAGASGQLGRHGVRRIMLTASGGPFRTKTRAELGRVTPEEACAHPNWSMGPKISVDSATMMNKALEVIEAHWLFGATADQLHVVIHPQSVVHSMVEYADGSVLAQLGNPDMRTPIAYGLAYPERIDSGVKSLSLPSIGSLSFEEPDFGRFPALRLAYEVIAQGNSASAVFNAANEVAVDAFLKQQLSFTSITDVVEETLAEVALLPSLDLDGVLMADKLARNCASALIQRRSEGAGRPG
jgi:1-deoxy-D-xylulose-5-phosphate reductoisomerase